MLFAALQASQDLRSVLWEDRGVRALPEVWVGPRVRKQSALEWPRLEGPERRRPATSSGVRADLGGAPRVHRQLPSKVRANSSRSMRRDGGAGNRGQVELILPHLTAGTFDLFLSVRRRRLRTDPGLR